MAGGGNLGVMMLQLYDAVVGEVRGGLKSFCLVVQLLLTLSLVLVVVSPHQHIRSGL